MADEAFALSPISARAAQPSEADYDAIQEAFMETSRGRWFLGEYAKRNRNADTRMVLDAVARIEDTLAASKKPVRDPLLDQALESFRAALTQAREATQAAVADLALEQNLAPVRKGIRIIREISWRWREIGTDGRICDLIDSQVGAIEAAADRMAPGDLAGALSGAFDQIEQRIAAFDASEAAASPPPPTEAKKAEEVAPATAVEAEVETENPAENAGTMPTTSVAHAAEAAAADPSPPNPSPLAATDDAATAVADGEPPDAFDANDEALLDMVAMEMAAPDSDAAYEPKLEDIQIYEDQVQAGPVHEGPLLERQAQAGRIDEPVADEIPATVESYEIDVTFPDSSDPIALPATASALPMVTPLQRAAAPAPEVISVATPEAEAAPSLGSSLIANGIVPRPRATRTDPLAPIRRMSQTEKIAFFS